MKIVNKRDLYQPYFPKTFPLQNGGTIKTGSQEIAFYIDSLSDWKVTGILFVVTEMFDRETLFKLLIDCTDEEMEMIVEHYTDDNIDQVSTVFRRELT